MVRRIKRNSAVIIFVILLVNWSVISMKSNYLVTISILIFTITLIWHHTAWRDELVRRQHHVFQQSTLWVWREQALRRFKFQGCCLFKILLTNLLQTGKNEINYCLHTLVALVDLERLFFCLLLRELLLQLQ
jgi:hypothetical protein